MSNPFHPCVQHLSPWTETNVPPSTIITVTSACPTNVYPLEYVLDRIGLWHWRHYLAILIGVIIGSLNVLLALLLLVYPLEPLRVVRSENILLQYLIGGRHSLIQGYRCFSEVLMVCMLLGTVTSAGMTAISSSRRQPLMMIIGAAAIAAGLTFMVVQSSVATVLCLTALHVCIGGAFIVSLLYLTDLVNRVNLYKLIAMILAGISVVVFATLFAVPDLRPVPVFYLTISLLLVICLLGLYHCLPDSPLSLLQANREDTCWKALALLAGGEPKLAQRLGVPNTDLLRLEVPQERCGMCGEGNDQTDPPPYRPSTFFLLQKYAMHLGQDLICNSRFRMTAISVTLLCWLQTSANILGVSCGAVVFGPLQLVAVLTGFALSVYLGRPHPNSRRSLTITSSALLLLHLIIFLLVLNAENAQSPTLVGVRWVLEVFITMTTATMWGVIGTAAIHDIPHAHRPVILLFALLPCLPLVYYSAPIVDWLRDPIYILLIVILLHTSTLSLAIKTHRNTSPV